jgi:hypothetical protein
MNGSRHTHGSIAIGCPTFRATGITAYLSGRCFGVCSGNRATKLYDRTKERLSQDEVERIKL